MNQEQIDAKIENFITINRKICWEAQFEKGEYCIEENKVRLFIEKLLWDMRKIERKNEDRNNG